LPALATSCEERTKKEEVLMTTKSRLLFGAAAIACTIVTIVHATPIVGLLVGTILSSGTTKEDIMQKVRVPLPPTASATTSDDDNEWTARLFTSGSSDVIVQDVVYAPGGHTGWHSHPGILLSSVVSGSIEWYDSRCERHVYNPGDSLTESTETHYVRNVGSVNAEFMVTYVIAHGQPRRIDEPAPPCAAALGLE
jgi:quercetin dioxygenase-like cupin family protein